MEVGVKGGCSTEAEMTGKGGRSSVMWVTSRAKDLSKDPVKSLSLLVIVSS